MKKSHQTTHPLEKSVHQAYNEIAEDFSASRKYHWPDFNFALPTLKSHNNPDILDLGCGNGRFINFLKDHLSNFTYTGQDFSENLLEIAKKSHPKTKFTLSDLTDLPYPDQNFDLIISIAAFHHLATNQNRLKCLEEIHRTLKPYGKAIITVWQLYQTRYKKQILESLAKKLRHPLKHQFKDLQIPFGKSKIPRYYHAFTMHELKKLLKNSPFKQYKLFYLNNGNPTNLQSGKNIYIELSK